MEDHYLQRNARQNINASPFEILTATAFHLFSEQEVQVAVVEVGMGGTLDATNILQNQSISVIAKIARDHEAFLGTTLEQIALHKAGILRPNVPYIVNPSNEWNVQQAIDQYARDIGAGPRLTGESHDMQNLYSRPSWRAFAHRLEPFQLDNAVLAMVAMQEASKSVNASFWPRQMDWMLGALHPLPLPGRTEQVDVPPVFGSDPRSQRKILVDGAHNPDAALALAGHVSARERQRNIEGRRAPNDGWPVTWVLAMTKGKDARQYLQHLLRPGDNVVTTSFGPVDGMPWVKPMDPKQLLDMAQSVEPNITGLHMTEPGPLRALCAARHLAEGNRPIVLTGSLYFVGDLHRELRPRAGATYATEPRFDKDRAMFNEILEEERIRVNLMLSGTYDASPLDNSTGTFLTVEQKTRIEEREKRIKLQEQVHALDEELKQLSELELSLQESPVNLEYPALAQFVAQRTGSKGDPHQELEERLVSDKMQNYLKTLDAIRAKLQMLLQSTNIAPSSYTIRAEAKRQTTQGDEVTTAEGQRNGGEGGFKT